MPSPFEGQCTALTVGIFPITQYQLTNCVQGVRCRYLGQIGAPGRLREPADFSEGEWHGVYTLLLTPRKSFS